LNFADHFISVLDPALLFLKLVKAQRDQSTNDSQNQDCKRKPGTDPAFEGFVIHKTSALNTYEFNISIF
jgi:hypothetical protein